MKLLSVFALLVLSIQLVFAQANYGPEFSFTNQEIISAMSNATDYNNPTNVAKLDAWKAKLEELCGGGNCQIRSTRDKHGKAYRVTFPDGWWIQYGVDTGCLEVQTKPQSVEEFQARRGQLQEYVYDSARSIGLKPHERIGGGHINVDFARAFNNDFKTFRNFVVDQANHPELIWGIFGNHIGNAPPISALEPRLHEEFARIIAEFDARNIQGQDVQAIRELAKAIQTRVYVSNPYWLSAGKKTWTPSYYQHLSFRSIFPGTAADQQRIELRGFRPQQSVQEFLLEIEFIDSRLEYLANLERPLEVRIPENHEMPNGQKKARFLEMLEEMNLSTERFSELMPEAIRRATPTPFRGRCVSGLRSVLSGN